MVAVFFVGGGGGGVSTIRTALVVVVVVVVVVVGRGLVLTLLLEAAAAVRRGERREVGLMRALDVASCCSSCYRCCWFCRDPGAVVDAAAGVTELEQRRPVALWVEVGEGGGRKQPPTQGKEERGTHKVHPLHIPVFYKETIRRKSEVQVHGI